MTPLPRLHLVTDDAVLADPSFADVAGRVLETCGAGVALHVRGHATSGAQLHALTDRLRHAAVASGAWLLVNDRVDIAMAVCASGVQLGARSMPVSDARRLLGDAACIGCSVHDAGEAVQAQRDGADFVLLGTIYESVSHPGQRAAGSDLVRDAAERTTLPVIAIGGITPDRIKAIAAAGAYGAAVLGGIWRAAGPAAAAAAYMEGARAAWPYAQRDEHQHGRTA
ncbi:MAG TPA: thiamine phosphate synthase [Longimicrobiales bacterium]|nr:thiamine phosphate synthase [Longimicrobiales bacterium]